MTTNNNRKQFRHDCKERDKHECIIPWCNNSPDEVHHIIERRLWDEGGYIKNNGASVCNKHHRYAEENHIPPQAFWLWADVAPADIPLPDQLDTIDVNKWGDEFDTPPWEDIREDIKYQSSRHLLPLYWHDDTLADERIENQDTELGTLEDFVGIPLVITHKMDGGNCMLVNDIDNPVRARNGSKPEDTMEPLYEPGGLYWEQEVHQKVPDRLQVFGEWMWAKHSIHYGCDCDDPCDDVGPHLSDLVDYEDDRAYFQVFGVYDKELNLWLSWPRVEEVANELGFPTTPVIYCEDSDDEATFETEAEARQELTKHAHRVIDNGGEGIVVRSKFAYHYSQFGRRLGKYVRENHVDDDAKHWSKRTVEQNQVTENQSY